jgi:hypothetical protein
MHALTKPTFLENTAGMERGGTRGAVTFRDMVHVQTIGGELEEIRRYIISWFKTRPGSRGRGPVRRARGRVDTARASPAVFYYGPWFILGFSILNSCIQPFGHS